MHYNNPKDNEKKGNNGNNPTRQMPNIYMPQLIGGQVPNRLQAFNLGNPPPIPALGRIPNMDNLRGLNINNVPGNAINPPERQIFLEDIQLPEYEKLFGPENQQMEPVRQAQPGQQVVQPVNDDLRDVHNLNDPRVLGSWNDYVDSIQRAEKTCLNYKRYVKQFFDYMVVNDILNPSKNDVLNYIRQKKANGAKQSVAKEIIISIRQFFTWAYERKICDSVYLPRGEVNKIYKEDNQVHQELSDPNSEDDEYRALEKLLGSVSQQLPPIRGNRRLQQPQNVFGVLQQVQVNIELPAKKKLLNEKLSKLAKLNRLDDPRIKEAWELYLDIYIVEKDININNKHNFKSYVNGFIKYLKEKSISTPSRKDILDFIGNRRMVDDITFGTALNLLSSIRLFFRFVSEFGIYDDVSFGLKQMDIRKIYGLAANPVKKTSAMQRRQNFE